MNVIEKYGIWSLNTEYGDDLHSITDNVWLLPVPVTREIQAARRWNGKQTKIFFHILEILCYWIWIDIPLIRYCKDSMGHMLCWGASLCFSLSVQFCIRSALLWCIYFWASNLLANWIFTWHSRNIHNSFLKYVFKTFPKM